MTTTSLELSKELYAISGLPGESGPDQEWYEKRIIGSFEVDIIAPKYRLSYLLDKLPRYIGKTRLTIQPTGIDQWCASYDYDNGDSTRECFSTNHVVNAAAQLAIELYKSKILTREKL